ncbi:Ribosomal RNA small subunit methyltransferase H [Candidatus Portiera aleyrodidarum]|uniref:Ribosomal RNA small subunit methyltransferase H n=1 Tax=Candidatus Portiera aleyrodidarum TV TaxID=1297582 RepID=A0A8D3X7L2_9GAMM|nr:16S rRNA (cytosine(1402)-N(4))-methyltransferase RsmH [Candidatus Portiera aleyrodidarum]AGI27199.1 S-adenosyl-methyltransferase MraW [Candidatus Portiera aleyrodidarum TV]CEI59184.1 Ribosomal RNA small subunit methyltransferase H [Candidatus Portiera aleyrodidarum]
MKNIHKSLFINKAIDLLITSKDGIYIDCTFGLGGHSKNILHRLSNKGKLIAIDNDLNTMVFAKKLGIFFDKRFKLINTNFCYLERIAKKCCKKVSGIILDLGISKNQIKDYKRGFSFYINGPLDMRINNKLGITAFDFLNNYKTKEIFKIFKIYGEEKKSYIITKKICKRRIKYPFKMTLELSNLIKIIKFKKHKHPATKVFQSIRIYINNELQNIEVLINSSLKILNINTKLIIITFNSLESHLVKKVIKNNMKKNNLFNYQVYPNTEEIIYNNSSRSATMYIIKKLKQSTNYPWIK